jgi:molecular chaperone HtpG
MGESAMPIVITQNEYMRRMKEMAAMQPGMNFYGDMPDSYSLTVNIEHPMVAKIITAADNNLNAQIAPITAEINDTNAKIEAINKEIKDNKPTAEQEKQRQDLMAIVDKDRKSESEIISGYSVSQPVIRQLIDLALLGNGLLKGADLSAFINRSVNLL